ncbi:MAG: diguanylate cyclase [Bacteroidetes bacterium GWF2_33_16]|nr:MAG: diguanylate cyclase [Bacteroidetes bacterium GWE2_32_14]OFY06972.1 MAG: diguanylate cyclase [Bacteroidetes bacterium GWF2_33_16]
MANLTVSYLGLTLRNPIIAASSGLTNSISDIKEFEERGAGAIVLKSIFEEEIRRELEKDLNKMNRANFLYPETMDYYDTYASDDSLTNYLKLISDSKKAVKIPIIASINCVTAEKWPYYAQNLQDAGADALELNIFVMPSDFTKSADENEKVYFNIVKEVKKHVKIPVALKISYYSANLSAFIQNLSNSGIQGLVLFNRFYSPDIDINNYEVLSTNVLSSPKELSISLRWIAIMSGRVGCDLAATTGIHDGAGVIKQLLAGANVVQVASAFYKNGKEQLTNMLDDLTTWMDQKGYKTIDEFHGKMSQAKINNPAAYERMQFMKYFAGKGL